MPLSGESLAIVLLPESNTAFSALAHNSAATVIHLQVLSCFNKRYHCYQSTCCIGPSSL
jgi:hypothetical protein